MASSMLLMYTLPYLLLMHLVVAVLPATQSSVEVYWDKALPNTPLPRAIRQLLPPADFRKNCTVDGVAGNATPTPGLAVDNVIPLDKMKYEGPGNVHNIDKGDVNGIYFLDTKLQVGTTMSLYFRSNVHGAKFLPPEVAEHFPLSSKKLRQLMDISSIMAQSVEAKAMKQTIEVCDNSAQQQMKLCPTSLESMINFTTSILGEHILPMSTELNKVEDAEQHYTVVSGVQGLRGGVVSCHILPYVYPVFYCHSMASTEAYKIPLVGSNGTKVSAIVICHKDTSKWNPKHSAFYQLNVKPGSVPVCHFLGQDDVAWVAT